MKTVDQSRAVWLNPVWRPFLACVILCFLFCTLTVHPVRASDYLIPYRTISVDGNRGDWTGIEPVLTDEINDEDPLNDQDGSDIHEFYLAKDDTYVYFLMTLYDGDPDLDTQFAFQTLQNSDVISTAGDIVTATRYDGNGWVVYLTRRGDSQDGQYPIANYGYGYAASGDRCIEWKTRLSDIGVLHERYVWVNTHTFGLWDSTPTAPVNDVNDPGNRPRMDDSADYDTVLPPILLYPSDQSSDVSLTPYLQTHLFSYRFSGDAHQQTDWQISTESDFTPLILEESGPLHLTSLPVPEMALQENILYYWRARFHDSRGNVSQWSDAHSFTTISAGNDLNGDGIPDTLENGSVDLNSDGIPDAQQDNVKSLNSVVGDGQVGISVDSSSPVISIDRINSIDPQTVSRYARPESMTLGLFAVRAELADAGDSARVTIHFSTPAPENAGWYFYDPINRWTDFSQIASFSQDRKSITLDLQDGGLGDADGAANGVIVDPSGFGVASWIKGTVTDVYTGSPIQGAAVRVKDADLVFKSMDDGSYVSMILPGTYDLSVSATGYQSMEFIGIEVQEAGILTQDAALNAAAANDCTVRAKIRTEEKGYIDGIWKKGGEAATSRGDRVVWGYFYASPDDVSWGDADNPELYVKLWYDVSGRVDANFFHVSVPDIEVFADYGNLTLQGTSTMEKRYIRLYYNDNSVSGKAGNTEDGIPAHGYTPAHSPAAYVTANNLSIGAVINTVEAAGTIDAVWKQGGTAVTSRGDEVVWGYFYADPSDVSWGSSQNPELFVKIWFDAGGRIDVNYFHVSVPDIEIYSDYGSDGSYDNKGTAVMDDRYIRHEYMRQ